MLLYSNHMHFNAFSKTHILFHKYTKYHVQIPLHAKILYAMPFCQICISIHISNTHTQIIYIVKRSYPFSMPYFHFTHILHTYSIQLISLHPNTIRILIYIHCIYLYIYTYIYSYHAYHILISYIQFTFIIRIPAMYIYI